jgi:hypothetical protein
MAWILAVALLFAASCVAPAVLDGASWQTTLWSAPWKAAAALVAAGLCDLACRFLTWRPARPPNAAPPQASGRSG